MPRSCPGGGWAQLELTDALSHERSINSGSLEKQDRGSKIEDGGSGIRDQGENKKDDDIKIIIIILLHQFNGLKIRSPV